MTRLKASLDILECGAADAQEGSYTGARINCGSSGAGDSCRHQPWGTGVRYHFPEGGADLQTHPGKGEALPIGIAKNRQTGS